MQLTLDFDAKPKATLYTALHASSPKAVVKPVQVSAMPVNSTSLMRKRFASAEARAAVTGANARFAGPVHASSAGDSPERFDSRTSGAALDVHYPGSGTESREGKDLLLGAGGRCEGGGGVDAEVEEGVVSVR